MWGKVEDLLFLQKIFTLMRFIGDYTAKTDAKGRVFLPAPLRKALEAEGEQKFVLRKDLFQPCVVLYPVGVWNDMFDAFRQRLNPYNAKHQMLLRQFAADAETVEPDSNGRILVSKRKLEFAGITGEIRFLAVDDHIELWNSETLELSMNDSDLGAEIENILGGSPL